MKKCGFIVLALALLASLCGCTAAEEEKPSSTVHIGAYYTQKPGTDGSNPSDIFWIERGPMPEGTSDRGK